MKNGKWKTGEDYMDRRLLTIVAVTAILVARTAAANDTSVTIETGNTLLDHCQSANNADRVYCRGYSGGVIDTLSSLHKICPPVGEIPQQVSDIIVNYLIAHPERRQEPASWLAYAAFLAVWPCR
jgi:Rap1a immunity proteins